MEWITEMITDTVLAVLGVAVTYLASRLGTLLGKFVRERLQDDTARRIADTCIRAVEQMYRENSGEEKLERALLMGEELLLKKGISVSAEEMRILLEAALSEAKGAFEKV